jgi:hypothetical protein
MDKPLPRNKRVDPKHPCAQLFCSQGLSVGRVRPYPLVIYFKLLVHFEDEELLTCLIGLYHGTFAYYPHVIDSILLFSSRAIVWICCRCNAWYSETH